MTAVSAHLVSPSGSELAALVPPSGPHGRLVLGLCGAPGAGKTSLAEHLVRALLAAGRSAAHVPMDGFHLADAELARQGLSARKGAPETFDAWGYAALLARLAERPPYPVYVPGFDRTLEQPLAAAASVGPEVEVVVTEGNYLLLDRPEWRAVRGVLDEVWFVTAEEPVRTARLLARHEEFGKETGEARAWVASVDEPNARLIEASRGRADRELDVTGWRPA